MRTILSKTVKAEREEAIRLLGWLVCAKRPLKFHEIQTMKSINLERRAIEFEQRRFRVDPKDLCESLVEVRPDGSIELVHLTAKTYVSPFNGNFRQEVTLYMIDIYFGVKSFTFSRKRLDLQHSVSII
jgi:hypothetical protein